MIDSGQLFSDAMQLPLSERADLANQLLLSLEPEEPIAEKADAWVAEIAARQELIRQGNYTAYDWRETIDHMRKSLDERTDS